MTKVYINIKANRYEIKLKDHAGYNPGNDIVCASISQLVCTYIALLESLQIVCEEQKIESGDVMITFHSDKEKVLDYTEFLVTGLVLIEREYPKYLKICQCWLER